MRGLSQASVVLIEGPITKTTTYNGAASADLTDYEGPLMVVVVSGAGGAGATMDCKVQASDAAAGTYADVTGATFQRFGAGGGGTGDNVGGISSVKIPSNEVKPFIRVVATIAGTASYTYTVAVVGVKKTTSGS